MDSRRPKLSFLINGLLSFALLIVLPVAVLADEPEDSADETRVIIIGDDGEEVVIEMVDVHALVAEAMEGLDEVMAELEDMQLQVRLGKDNNLNLSYDDTTFELDLDQIMTQVASAVQEGLGEFQTEDWTHSRNRWTDVSDEDLRQELKDLKREMKELRRELRKITSEY